MSESRREYRDASDRGGASDASVILERPAGLRGRDFLGIADLRTEELSFLVDLAEEVKANPRSYWTALEQQSLALLFEKPSLRTRSTFEIGAKQLGMHVLHLGPQEIGIGKRESAADVARNLDRWVDAIVARVFSHSTLVEMARFAEAPIINGLCDLEHPCQIVADLQTLREHRGELGGRVLAWIGDGNNVLHSLIHAAGRLGMTVRAATPAGYEPDPSVVAAAREAGGVVELLRDPMEAVQGADFVYTDTWISMGQEAETKDREAIFSAYQVSAELMKEADPAALFLHCLPAKRGKEVTDEVLEGPTSVVWDQAENRLHAQKAILLALLA